MIHIYIYVYIYIYKCICIYIHGRGRVCRDEAILAYNLRWLIESQGHLRRNGGTGHA